MLDASFGPRCGSFVSASEITDLGWAEKWKEHFKPQRIGRRITVKPSWEPYRAEPDEVVLTIDRITSYNVCYTKLLRPRRRWPPHSVPARNGG